ncbi:hypothetical protein [uncultured Methanobrevibacter sp.]|uniref:hypothetical protein n=1 Tax=uncultured Methanobrevibacter sp. TaxID=253161 RepID=UPI002603A5D5|nr:hypothetical protein [uncultured Methanobrevibacter sp.]
MDDKIMCPKCFKFNEMQKFCIYCGEKLLDDEQLRLMRENPNAYCLNCARPVKEDQVKCECGYELGDIKCPECGEKNAYANKFCTSCGKKIWTSDVYSYKYVKRLFENHLLNEVMPPSMSHLSVYKRSTNRSVWSNEPAFHYDDTLEKLKSRDLEANENLYEICSRWRLVSPNQCISCLRVYTGVCSCMTPFLTDKKRVDTLQSEKNNYIPPMFDNPALKWTSKNKHVLYLKSLAPAIGESQMEYRERLKWEFAENIYRKEKIKNAMANRKATKPKPPEPATTKRTSKGGYCNINCSHFFEEYIFDHDGDGDYYDEVPEYYCELGHPEIYTRSFCKDFE